jgi:RNA polymerase sigma-70 factor (ECF subfamily)
MKKGYICRRFGSKKKIFYFPLIKFCRHRLFTVLQTVPFTAQPLFMAIESENPPSRMDSVSDLVQSYQGALLCYARSIVRDEEAARDVVQETFIRLWKNPPKPEATKAWLYCVCRSRAIDYLRKQKGVLMNDGDSAQDFFVRQPDGADTPSEAMEHAEMRKSLLRQVELLPARQGELVRLKFQAGLSYKEIADTTGLSVTNVGFILHTALTTLRQRMKQDSATSTL